MMLVQVHTNTLIVQLLHVVYSELSALDSDHGLHIPESSFWRGNRPKGQEVQVGRGASSWLPHNQSTHDFGS